MNGHTFQFKHFTINQENSAMKVGTDGVLLGAWSGVKEGEILDIGTGTGLIALMLAQRTKFASVDAVEINESAYFQSLENIQQCNWSDSINAHHCAIQEFEPSKNYDLIVCNPPFFVSSTKAPNEARNTARHTDSLSFLDLQTAVKRLLKSDGTFTLILPTNEVEHFIETAKEKGLFLTKRCIVFPNSNKKSKRTLMEFSNYKAKVLEHELTIETESRHQYTKEYISLTHQFYL